MKPLSNYDESFSRNMGLLSLEDQMVLRQSRIAVLGLGGLGGPCFEILVRTGIGAFHIADHDVFEASNKNRQIHAKNSTLGRKKIDVAEGSALDINEELIIKKYEAVDESNIADILTGCSAVVHGIDRLKPCIISARRARALDIPIVEGWALPFGNVRVLTRATPSMEEVYRLPTVGKAISEISDEEFQQFEMMIIEQLAEIEGIRAYYGADTLLRISRGQTPSFAPMVWFTSVMIAIEVVKICLRRGQLALGPRFKIYDPFEHQSRPMPPLSM